MHLAAFTHEGRTYAGALHGDRVIDLGALGYPATVEDWLAETPERIAEITSMLVADTTLRKTTSTSIYTARRT